MRKRHISGGLARAICSAMLILTVITPVLAENDPQKGESYGSAGHETEVTAVHAAYMTGYPDKTFRPDKSITRAEAAQILYNLLPGHYAVVHTPSFRDVKDIDRWYYNAVGYLESLKIISGYPDGTFRPDAEITRAELVTMLSKYYGELAAGESIFPDVGEEHWAVSYINSAASHGWIYGYPEDGTFRPNKGCTRAETAVIINRFLVRVETETPSGANPFNDVNAGHWAYGDIMEACIAHEATESIYHTILTKYKQAVAGGYVKYDKTVVCLELPLSAPSERENVYYAYKDMDGNGIPELFIGAGEDAEKALFDIYTLYNGEPVQLFKDMYIFGGRVNCVICSNGVYAIHRSNSAFESSTIYFNVTAGGYPPKLIEIIGISADETSTKYYHDDTWAMVEITKEEYEVIAQKYPESYQHYRGVEDMDWISVLHY